MKTNMFLKNRIKACLIAIVFTVEALSAGFISVNAQPVTDEAIIDENIMAETIISENSADVDLVTEIEEEVIDRQKAEGEEEFTGASGSDSMMTWNITSDGHLTAEGALKYGQVIPWQAYKKYIVRATVKIITKYDKNNNPIECSLRNWFAGCNNLKTVDFTDSDMSQVLYLEGLFNKCSSLKTCNFSDMDFPKAKTMSMMFEACTSLESISFDNVKFSNCKDASRLFYGCSNLKVFSAIDCDFSALTSTVLMFYGCKSLEEIDLSSFKSSPIESTVGMFYDCDSLKNIDLSGLNTEKVTDMSDMFCDCDSLEVIDLTPLNTSNVTNMSYMFDACNNLTEIDISCLDTGKVTRMSTMFNYCLSLKSIDMHNLNLQNLTDMEAFASSCIALETCDFSGIKTGQLKTVRFMFRNCQSIQTLDLSDFDFSTLTNTSYMFENTDALQILHMPPLATGISLYKDMICEDATYASSYADASTTPLTYYDYKYAKTGCYKSGHTYKAPEFIWNKFESVRAVFECEKKECIVPDYCIELPARLQSVTTKPTADKDGCITYTATVEFEGKVYTDIAYITLPSYKNGSGKAPDNAEKNEDKQQTPSATETKTVKKGDVLTVSGAKYKVTKIKGTKGEVEYVSTIKKTKKTVTIPATIKSDGITYKVTSIAKNAFKNNKKLTKVTIGKNVTKIGSKAFYGCKKLKTIKINSKKLKSVGKNAIKGIHKNARIDVPNSKRKAYKKLFKKNTGYKSTMSIK